MKTINTITVISMNSKFVKSEHLNLLVDGKPIDQIIYEYYQDDYYLGLIPMLSDWISMDEEAIFVRDLFYLDQELKILPILMCPDDCDFSCTIIVAEVKTYGDHIIWQRIGIDESKQNKLTDIRWLDKVPPMKFNKENYKVLETIYNHKEI